MRSKEQSPFSNLLSGTRRALLNSRNLLGSDERYTAIPIINKFNFPSEMVYFEETRNDLYITLERGEFSNDNVEIVVEVKLDDGDRVQVLFRFS